MPTDTSERPLRVAFLTLQSGAHGEYGALLAAAVADAGGDNVEVLNIVPEALAASERAQVSLGRTMTRTVALMGAAAKLRAPGAVLRMLRNFRPDVIHDPVGSGVSALLPMRPFLPRIAPLVVTEHNPTVHPGMTGWHHGIARRMTRRTASLIHVHGPKALAEMQNLDVPEARLAVIRHGAFDEYSDKVTGFDRGTCKQILVFGALRPNKGIDMLPEILRRVRAHHPDTTLLVAGKRPAKIDGASGKKIDDALAELSAMPGCEIRNAHVPEEDIPRLFGSCGVCLLPYHSATQSGVAMIAMTTGAPVVASAVGDIPDIVTHGETGLLAEPSPGALAMQVITALDDLDAMVVRAEAARRFTREDCAWPVIGERMLAAYRALPRVTG